MQNKNKLNTSDVSKDNLIKSKYEKDKKPNNDYNVNASRNNQK